MSLGEFDLIDAFFRRPAGVGPQRAVVGNGDDCAVIAPGPGMQLALSTDTLVEGRHFLSTVAPERLGHKALAVNLSDLAACGARPLGFTLALTLPRADADWLAALARGLFALADAHDCELVGGDTTAGPLAIGITVFGEVPAGAALLRSGACVGDEVWVSGHPGEARLALEAFRGTLQPGLSTEAFEACRRAMEQPWPRVDLGLGLRGLATAAIDVSDGLLGDLGHVLRRSGAGADLFAADVPVSPWLAQRPREQQLDCLLAGGDDYELLFTAPAARHAEVLALGQRLNLRLSRIGRVRPQPGCTVWSGSCPGDTAPGGTAGEPLPMHWASFDHFAAPGPAAAVASTTPTPASPRAPAAPWP
jgi:thiamine-monophosphate kinase